MTNSEMLTHLAPIQDAICDILEESMTVRDIRARLDAVYPRLDAVIDDLLSRESAMIADAMAMR